MSISCSCDFDGGIHSVGYPREVVCRTPRDCSCCERPVGVGSPMHILSMYDFDDMKTSSPCYMCEECGDMFDNLVALGFCFSLSEGIRDQWLDYLHDEKPEIYAMVEKYEPETIQKEAAHQGISEGI